MAHDTPPLHNLILQRPLEELPQHIANQPQFAEFNAGVQRYLDLYGFRSVNELKLEECSLQERPHLVYKTIRNYLLLDNPAALDVNAIAARERKIRRQAQQQAFAALTKAAACGLAR